MIRGPILPQMRERLWSLVAPRLEVVECGLTLVHETFDCSEGELGPVDGLARDAMGAPVLVLLAVEGDAMLPARALAAGQFLRRIGDSLSQAVPEAGFTPGLRGRVLVVGTDSSAKLVAQLRGLPVFALQVCMLEPFRVANTERFAVRWLVGGDAAEDAATDALPEFQPPAEHAELWRELQHICRCLESGVQLHGDRFSRRVLWHGRVLGHVRTVEGKLVATPDRGVARDLRDRRDLRRFANEMLRVLLAHARIDLTLSDGRAVAAAEEPADKHTDKSVGGARQTSGRIGASGDRSDPTHDSPATRHAVGAPAPRSSEGESLRASLAAARLSPEEYSALGGPAASAAAKSAGSVARERS